MAGKWWTMRLKGRAVRGGGWRPMRRGAVRRDGWRAMWGGGAMRRGPVRRMAVGALVTSVGNGAWYTSWAVFLTRSVGLSPAAVGLGMTLAGACGILLATPIGHLADRLGPREVFGALQVVRAAGCVAYLAVDGPVLFAV